jgi:hypothetical protein
LNTAEGLFLLYNNQKESRGLFLIIYFKNFKINMLPGKNRQKGNTKSSEDSIAGKATNISSYNKTCYVTGLKFI